MSSTQEKGKRKKAVDNNSQQMLNLDGVNMKDSDTIAAHEGWLTIGDYNVFAWSLSGVESCVAVKCEDFYICFDMGVALEESVRARNIFITHGHLDHIGAVTSHISKRRLISLPPARYYVPQHLAEPLTRAVTAHFEMAEALDCLKSIQIVPFDQEDTAQLKSTFFVKSFPTEHRVKSQGYIVYKQEKKLKQEYHGMDGFEIAKLHREGTPIHDIITSPEIAYTGDTTFSVFSNPPIPDLLKVKLLITETTYIDQERGKDVAANARNRGHIHLSEIADHEELFQDVGHILLVHFSAKYPPKYIIDILRDKLPAALRTKVTPALVAKLSKPHTITGDRPNIY